MPLFIQFHLGQRTLNFRDKIYPKKVILGTEFKITIVEFEISPLEYPFVLRFILNKAV